MTGFNIEEQRSLVATIPLDTVQVAIVRAALMSAPDVRGAKSVIEYLDSGLKHRKGFGKARADAFRCKRSYTKRGSK